MSDPLFDPLPEVLAEFGSAEPTLEPPGAPAPPRGPAHPEAAASPVTTKVEEPAVEQVAEPAGDPVAESVAEPVAEPVVKPIAQTPAPRVVPDGPPRPRPLQSGWTPSADLADLRDGLAGMRTDLRQVPEQVGQAIAGTVLHSVSVALSDVRRPLESMGLITEQLGAILGRLDAVAGLRDQMGNLEGVPEAIESSRAQIDRDLGGLASELAAILTRVTTLDGAVADLAANTSTAGESVQAAIHDEIGKAVRDQLRDLVRDGVHDGVTGSLDEGLQATISQAVVTAQTEIEARIRAHVDDAVMNLADVLMRHQAALVREAAELAPPKKAESKVTKAAKATKVEPGRAKPAKRASSAIPVEPRVVEDDEDDEGESSELDALITRMPAAESLAEAVSNAVRRAGLDLDSDEPRFQVPTPDPDAPRVEDVLASWSERVEAVVNKVEPTKPARKKFFRDRRKD